jgi:hypothetical protein
MEVSIKLPASSTPTKPSSIMPKPSIPNGLHLGEWGRVKDRHSEDNTVDVLLESSVYLKRVMVASEGWVISGDDVEKDYNAGERNLPPLKARVFVWTPTLVNYNDCFIAPFSGFPTIDKPDPFMKEEKEEIRERINPNKWHTTEDHVTGSFEAISPDELTNIKIDYGSKDAPLVPPELHAKLFHDPDKDDPGIKLDVVSGKTVDMSVFKDIKLHHEKEKIITAEIFEETNFEYNKEEGIIKGDIFDKEANFEYEKGKEIKGDFFNKEMEYDYKKGDVVAVKLFQDEASFTHKKGKQTVIKAFNSTITLKQGKVIIKTSSDITHDVPVYIFTGNTSKGRVTPKGKGVYCAIQFCPFSGLPQTG